MHFVAWVCEEESLMIAQLTYIRYLIRHMFNINNKRMQRFPFHSHKHFDWRPFSQPYQLAISVVCYDSFASYWEIPRYWIKNILFKSSGDFIHVKMKMHKARLIQENVTLACLSWENSRCCSGQSYFSLSLCHGGKQAMMRVCWGLGCIPLCCALQSTMITKVINFP